MHPPLVLYLQMPSKWPWYLVDLTVEPQHVTASLQHGSSRLFLPQCLVSTGLMDNTPLLLAACYSKYQI